MTENVSDTKHTVISDRNSFSKTPVLCLGERTTLPVTGMGLAVIFFTSLRKPRRQTKEATCKSNLRVHEHDEQGNRTSACNGPCLLLHLYRMVLLSTPFIFFLHPLLSVGVRSMSLYFPFQNFGTSFFETLKILSPSLTVVTCRSGN